MTRSEFENEIKKLVQLTASQYCGLSRVSTCPHKAIHIIGTFRVKKDQYVFKFENDKNDKHGIKDNMAFDFEIPAPILALTMKWERSNSKNSRDG